MTHHTVPRGIAAQPVGQVEWVPRDELHANDYNPNAVAPPELRLLRLSILEDGWTQPIVARPDGQIVDGYHRWTIAADPDVAALTDGKVPVVRLRPVPYEHQMMSTIRHNRARGTHAILPMCDIVRHLIDNERLEIADVMARLGMEREEVERLYERGNMLKRGVSADLSFNTGWVAGE